MQEGGSGGKPALERKQGYVSSTVTVLCQRPYKDVMELKQVRSMFHLLVLGCEVPEIGDA